MMVRHGVLLWMVLVFGCLPQFKEEIEEEKDAQIESCVPDCNDKECGDDKCGGVCGYCSASFCNTTQRCESVNYNIEFVLIEGGAFMMGSEDGYSGELPVHQVNVPDFEMSKTEVTVAQYRACVDAGECSTPDTGYDCNWNVSGRENHPINCVDWNQAKAFSTWAGGRLPTEAEWEYAARSEGQAQTYPWGNAQATCDYAVMDDGGYGCGRDRTWPVCSKTRGNTEQGLCDMAGNVWEWVADYYADYNSTPCDGTEQMSGSERVNRGGSWYNYASYLLATNRSRNDPGVRNYYLGFRVARSHP